MEKQPHELCPRFDKCCVNICPLHPDYKKLQVADTDPQQKCTLAKSIRKRLGASLAWKGMTDSEISGQKRWDSLPQEVKDAKIAKLKERSLITRLSKKGYAMIPKASIHSQNTYKNEIETPNLMGEMSTKYLSDGLFPFRKNGEEKNKKVAPSGESDTRAETSSLRTSGRMSDGIATGSREEEKSSCSAQNKSGDTI